MHSPWEPLLTFSGYKLKRGLLEVDVFFHNGHPIAVDACFRSVVIFNEFHVHPQFLVRKVEYEDLYDSSRLMKTSDGEHLLMGNICS